MLFTLKNKHIRFLFARTYSICFVVIKPHNKKGISRTVITVNIAFYSYYYFDINKLYNKLGNNCPQSTIEVRPTAF